MFLNKVTAFGLLYVKNTVNPNIFIHIGPEQLGAH